MCAPSQYDVVTAALSDLPGFAEVEPGERGYRVYRGMSRQLYVSPAGKVRSGHTLNRSRLLPAEQLAVLLDVGRAKLAKREAVAA